MIFLHRNIKFCDPFFWQILHLIPRNLKIHHNLYDPGMKIKYYVLVFFNLYLWCTTKMLWLGNQVFCVVFKQEMTKWDVFYLKTDCKLFSQSSGREVYSRNSTILGTLISLLKLTYNWVTHYCKILNSRLFNLPSQNPLVTKQETTGHIFFA